MLRPPGQSTSGTAPTRRTAKHTTQESPDDIVRRLARTVPANKKCCDCGGKLPNSVNVTIGSFVCMTCAGIQRELRHRIKGVGHSSFTVEEALQLQQHNNEQINAIWMARYNPRTERLTAPNDSNTTDPRALRAWILRKYKDKAWHADDGTTSGAVGPTAGVSNTTARTTSSTNHHHKSNSAGGSSPVGRGVAGKFREPTVAIIPPKSTPVGHHQRSTSSTNHKAPASAPAPAVDLFGGFEDNVPAAAAVPNNTNSGDWDAFGGSSLPSQDFGADFGNQNFAQFSNTASSQPPTSPGFGNFGGPPQQQQQQVPTPVSPGFGNFGGPPQQHPQQHQAPPPSSPGFGNFGGPTQQHQQQHQAPPPTSPGFGNFGGSTQQHQQQQAPPPTSPGFGNFGGPTQQHQRQQAPPQTSPGFGNFGGPPQQHQQQNQAPASPGFGNFGDFEHFPPPQQQQQQFGQFPQQQQNNIPNQSQAYGQFPNQQPQQSSHEDKFDAFNSLQQPTQSPTVTVTEAHSNATVSLEASQPKVASSSTSTAVSPNRSPEPQPHPPSTSKYQAGQKVYYRSASYVGAAQIVKVHLDDALEPFYTIQAPPGNHQEKQTDNGHLDEMSPLQKEIVDLLWNMSLEQQNQVKHYIMSLSSSQWNTGNHPSTGAPPTVPSLNGGTDATAFSNLNGSSVSPPRSMTASPAVLSSTTIASVASTTTSIGDGIPSPEAGPKPSVAAQQQHQPPPPASDPGPQMMATTTTQANSSGDGDFHALGGGIPSPDVGLKPGVAETMTTMTMQPPMSQAGGPSQQQQQPHQMLGGGPPQQQQHMVSGYSHQNNSMQSGGAPIPNQRGPLSMSTMMPSGGMANGGGGGFGIPSPPGGSMASAVAHPGGLPMAPSLGGHSQPPSQTMSNGTRSHPEQMMTMATMMPQQQHGQMMMTPQQQGQSTMTMPSQQGMAQPDQPMQFQQSMQQQQQQGTTSTIMPNQTLQQQQVKLEPPMSPQGNPFDFY